MLGDLSARYESGKRGSEAIGWDNRGQLSLGKYQIAYGVGTLKKFLNFCKNHHSTIWEALWPLYGTITPGTESKRCAFAKKWIELARSGALGRSEHDFIKASHFDKAFQYLPGEIQVFVAASMALQQVLWSTAVQHGPAGAKKVFTRAWSPDNTPKQFIEAIYNQRAKRLGGLTPRVQSAVRQRFADESKKAIAMLDSDVAGEGTR